MDIEGTYTLQALPEEVWRCLMDQQTLRQTIPGLERLEPLERHCYAFTLRVKQAPLRGVYQGQVEVDNIHYPLVYHLSLQGDEQHPSLQGIWEIQLSAQQENTVVNYAGTLNTGKMGALLPPTLVRGAIKILIQQFFTNLAEQLRSTEDEVYLALPFDESEERDTPLSPMAPSNGHRTVEASSPGQSQPQRTLLHTLVHMVGLGQHDAIQEELWVTRLKRFGTFSILLLLVWVGTRLPRRLFSHN